MTDITVDIKPLKKNEQYHTFWQFEFPLADAPLLDTDIQVEIKYTLPNGAVVPHIDEIYRIRAGYSKVSGMDDEDWASYENKMYFFSAMFKKRFLTGTIATTITWKDGDEDKTFEHEAPAGTAVNLKQDAAVSASEPYLSQALIAEWSGPTDSLPDAPSEDADEWRGKMVQDVLKYVYARLQWGLTEFWRGFGGKCVNEEGVPLSDLEPSNLSGMEQLEEAWAQLVSENFVGAAYLGPGSYMNAPVSATAGGYTDGHTKDGWVTQKQVERQNADDPFHPIIFACQQLSTYVVMSLGHDGLADYPLGARPDTSVKRLEGEKHEKFSAVSAMDKDKSISKLGNDERGLKPGAGYYVDEAAGNPHIGSVIRFNSADKFQISDTAYWIDQPWKRYGNMFDSESFKSFPKKCDGIYAPPAISEDELREAIVNLKLSRPLGVVRLVIVRTNSRGRTVALPKEKIWWVSPLLHMHEMVDSNFFHYGISRLISSLRGCPYADKLDIRWQISVPSNRVNNEPEKESLRAATDTGRTARWWEQASLYDDNTFDPKKTKDQIKPITEIALDTNHTPYIRRRNKTLSDNDDFSFRDYLADFDTTPVGSYSKKRDEGYHEIANMSGLVIPAYFRQGVEYGEEED